MGMTPNPNPNDDSNPNDPSQSDGSLHSVSTSEFDLIIAEFTARWNRGEAPRAEDFLGRLGKNDPDQVVELAYYEFRLAENDGLDPEINAFLKRFPDHAEGLLRLLSLHDALRSTSLRLGSEQGGDTNLLPEVGDSIGPYLLIEDLGRGAFAKVFLAEQTNLDDRLVVLKVSTKVTQEPKFLAKASHPNIVAVLTTTMVNGDAFQLICMPFLGGAALSALLNERRKSATKAVSGEDLLADVDRIQPKGYPAATSSRPARQILSAYSYSRAIAWIVARLAEGLHHAYSRGVVHGDVKPSNILITADGNPMLLDFNLSVGWTIDPLGLHGRNIAEDPGGTLAYMAPERLQSMVEGGQPELLKRPRAAERHRADIYSLGVVLLEALTGKPPGIPSAGKAVSPREIASAYVSSRLHGGKVMIRSAHGETLAADLKAILRHCLAPDPADRYQTADELAEDLDHWLRDRPLVYARKTKGLPALHRWARRHRLAVVLVAVALLAVVLATAVNRKIAHAQSERQALHYYEEIVNSRTPGTFRLRRIGSGNVRGQRDAAEVAREHLDRYDVLSDADWRSRDDVRNLPVDVQEELEALILEQSLRLAHALAQRSEPPDDWRRLSAVFSRIANTSPYPPLVTEIESLQGKFRSRGSESQGTSVGSSTAERPWIGAYLEGIARELSSDNKAALAHFLEVLKVKPNSFWANYRASAVAFSLITPNDPAASGTASKCLKVCVDQRPDNAVLRHQYATCLSMQKRYFEALFQYDRALRLNSENPETYLSRAFLRLRLNQIESFIEDIKSYENLIKIKAPVRDNELLSAFEGDKRFDREVGLKRRFSDDDDAEAMLRITLGEQLFYAGHYDVALEQLDRAFALKPESIRTRYLRAVQLYYLRNQEAEQEFALLVDDPKFESFTTNLYHDATFVYIHTASHLVRQGREDDALRVARLAVRIADRVKVRQSDAHFILATALALDARRHPDQFGQARDELMVALKLSPEQVRKWSKNEPLFHGPEYQLPEIESSKP